MASWRIGCSGFSYKEWKEVFYPAGLPQKKWLEYYCTKFNCLELNSTFYSFPRVITLQKLYDQTGPDFKFVVKAPQTFTHYRRFVNCEELVTKFYDTVEEGFREKLGPVLFQLPPSCKYSEEMLERILTNLKPSFKNVLEFRHDSWWREEVFEKLGENKITFSGVSHHKMPTPVIKNHSLLYYRLHGVPVMFKSEYSKDEINELFENINKYEAEEIYVLFNNTWGIAGDCECTANDKLNTKRWNLKEVARKGNLIGFWILDNKTGKR